MSDPGTEIAAAHVAMSHGDAATALAHLVAAWRQVPDRALAEAIEVIGPRAARHRGLAVGLADDDRDAAWLAAARPDDAALRGVLCATLFDGDAARRIEALAHHRDPRIATLAVTALLDAGRAGPSRVAERWLPFTGVLASCGDPRVVARIPEIQGCWRRAAADFSRSRIAKNDRRLAKLDARIAAAYPAAARAALDGLVAERPRLAEIVELARRPDAAELAAAAAEGALLAAIYAAPDDDGPRAVYADWLLERGDPRGELIALQLQPAHDRHRAYVLFDTYRARVLGALAPHISDSWLSCERGFVAECSARDRDVVPPPDPAWATVRTIHGAVPATDAHPMPALTTALELSRAALAHLAALAAPPPIERLTVAGGTWRDGVIDLAAGDAIAALAKLRLPTLRRLEVAGGADWREIGPERMPWPWRRFPLDELGVPTGMQYVVAWHRELIAFDLDRLVLEIPGHGGWTITLTRDALDAKNTWRFEANERDVAALADAIAVLPLAQLTIDVHHKTWTLASRRAIARALARHPALRHDIAYYVPPRR